MQHDSGFTHTSYFLDRAKLTEKGDDLRWAFSLAASVNAAKLRDEPRKIDFDPLPY